MGDAQAALQQMKLAEKLAPSYAWTYFSMGVLEAQIGHYQVAKEQLALAFESPPSTRTPITHSGACIINWGQKPNPGSLSQISGDGNARGRGNRSRGNVHPSAETLPQSRRLQ
jgi:hypothetical protein